MSNDQPNLAAPPLGPGTPALSPAVLAPTTGGPPAHGEEHGRVSAQADPSPSAAKESGRSSAGWTGACGCVFCKERERERLGAGAGAEAGEELTANPMRVLFSTSRLNESSLADCLGSVKQLLAKGYEKLPPLHVVQLNNDLVTMDNHLLYCYKKLFITSVPIVLLPPNERFISKVMGEKSFPTPKATETMVETVRTTLPTFTEWFLTLVTRNRTAPISEIPHCFHSADQYVSSLLDAFEVDFLENILISKSKEALSLLTFDQKNLKELRGDYETVPCRQIEITSVESSMSPGLKYCDFVLFQQNKSTVSCGLVVECYSDKLDDSLDEEEQTLHILRLVVFHCPLLGNLQEYHCLPPYQSPDVNIAIIANIIDYQRLYDGLKEFKTCNSELVDHILHPHIHDILSGCSDVWEPRHEMGKFNKLQRQAIMYAIEEPGITIIQGPPGTGKTSVVVGLVLELLLREKRVLICSTSNPSLSEIITRIKAQGIRDRMLLIRGAENRDPLHDDIAFDFLMDSHLSLHILSNEIRKEEPNMLKVNTLKKELKQKINRLNPDLRAIMGARLEFINSIQLNLPERPALPMDTDYAPLPHYTSGARLVFATTSMVASGVMHSVMQNAPSFDIVIVDEAGHCTEQAILLPLKYATKLVLIGDPLQLPPLVVSHEAKRAAFNRSMMERLIQSGHHNILLKKQYRMHPLICEFPSRFFYSNCLQNAKSVKSETKPWHAEPFFKPLAFFQFQGRELLDPSGSITNPKEAEIVNFLLGSWMKRYPTATNLGVITPYKKQAELLEGKLGYRCEVSSVDAFQGREKDVIIVSTVRSNTSQILGFVGENHRLNVLLTRAKYSLWIVGNSCTLASHPIWNALIKHCKAKGCFFDYEQLREGMKIPRKVSERIGEEVVDLSSLSNIWRIKVDGELVRSLGSLDTVARTKLVQMVRKLASGQWPKHEVLLQNRDNDPLNSVIHVSKLAADLLLVWRLDVMRHTESLQQILTLFRLIPPSELHNTFCKLKTIINAEAKVNLISVQLMCEGVRSEGTQKVPKVWSEEELRLLQRPPECAIPEETCTPTKYYNVSKDFLQELLSGSPGKLHLVLHPEEVSVIERAKSVFICGRSGTGKTTILLYRMLNHKQQAGDRNIKQIFLSKSSMLCAHAKAEIMALLGLSNQDNVPILDEIEQQYFTCQNTVPITSLKENHFPLFVSCRQLLNMIDMSLDTKFYMSKTSTPTVNQTATKKSHPKYKSGSGSVITPKTAGPAPPQKTKLPQVGTSLKSGPSGKPVSSQRQVTSTQTTLPPRNFSEEQLQTINPRLATVLTPDDISDDAFNTARSVSSAVPLDTQQRREFESREVEFSDFARDYWPGFDEKLKNGISDAKLWVEIHSHIKGVLDTNGLDTYVLSQEQYERLGRGDLIGTSPDKVYKLFKKYEEVKSRKEYSRNKRSHSVLNMRFDEIYVDEVQDCSMIQLSLFKFLCTNTAGYSFAGDTAQTIHCGVDFKFERLKDTFFDIVHRSRADAPKVVDELYKNYRTHIQICELANSLTSLVQRYFPDFIDFMRPEQTMWKGPIPVFLNATLHSLSDHFRFLARDMSIAFGCKQVVLVRNDDAKARLKRMHPNLGSGIVMTITESKGLEFQDVLLYDFWKDSCASSNTWRLLCGLLGTEGVPKFDVKKHHVLCSELKHLYTAVTRTRKLLIMVDEDQQKHEPLLSFWKTKEFISVQDALSEEQKGILAEDSSTLPTEWCHKAAVLMQNKMYTQAAVCYERGGDLAMRDRAHGMELITEWKTTGDMSKLEMAENTFSQLGLLSHVVWCQNKVKKWAEAGKTYQLMGNIKEAKRNYLHAKRPDLCFDMLCEVESENSGLSFATDIIENHNYSPAMIDNLRYKTVCVLKRHPEFVDSHASTREIIRHCAISWVTENETEKLRDLLPLWKRDQTQFLIRHQQTELLSELTSTFKNLKGQVSPEMVAKIMAKKGDWKNASHFYQLAAQISSQDTQKTHCSLLALHYSQMYADFCYCEDANEERYFSRLQEMEEQARAWNVLPKYLEIKLIQLAKKILVMPIQTLQLELLELKSKVPQDNLFLSKFVADISYTLLTLTRVNNPALPLRNLEEWEAWVQVTLQLIGGMHAKHSSGVQTAECTAGMRYAGIYSNCQGDYKSLYFSIGKPTSFGTSFADIDPSFLHGEKFSGVLKTLGKGDMEQISKILSPTYSSKQQCAKQYCQFWGEILLCDAQKYLSVLRGCDVDTLISIGQNLFRLCCQLKTACNCISPIKVDQFRAKVESCINSKIGDLWVQHASQSIVPYKLFFLAYARDLWSTSLLTQDSFTAYQIVDLLGEHNLLAKWTQTSDSPDSPVKSSLRSLCESLSSTLMTPGKWPKIFQSMVSILKETFKGGHSTLPWVEISCCLPMSNWMLFAEVAVVSALCTLSQYHNVFLPKKMFFNAMNHCKYSLPQLQVCEAFSQADEVLLLPLEALTMTLSRCKTQYVPFADIWGLIKLALVSVINIKPPYGQDSANVAFGKKLYEYMPRLELLELERGQDKHTTISPLICAIANQQPTTLHWKVKELCFELYSDESDRLFCLCDRRDPKLATLPLNLQPQCVITWPRGANLLQLACTQFGEKISSHMNISIVKRNSSQPNQSPQQPPQPKPLSTTDFHHNLILVNQPPTTEQEQPQEPAQLEANILQSELRYSLPKTPETESYIKEFLLLIPRKPELIEQNLSLHKTLSTLTDIFERDKMLQSVHNLELCIQFLNLDPEALHLHPDNETLELVRQEVTKLPNTT
ncbi:tRNA-splicing endonuclease positive effector [Pelomyxa schiedti]|nr:tRNA-splicing endonuclease positive effector [Pelomyxa schiedti]